MRTAPRARVFLALPCPTELGQELLALAVDALGGPQRAQRDFRLARPDGLHLTLFFLGDVARERCAVLWEATQAELAGLRAPALVIDRAASFPGGGRRPRVLWFGVREETDGRLAALHAGVLRAVGAAGFDLPGGGKPSLRPHVTIARPRRDAGAPLSLPAFGELAPGLAWQPGALALLESVRAHGEPARYPVLASLPFPT